MILLVHILIALSSLAVTAAVCIWPSRRLLQSSALLIALTLGSGTYLVMSLHTALLSACVSGLAFLAVSLAGAAFAWHKLRLTV